MHCAWGHPCRNQRPDTIWGTQAWFGAAWVGLPAVLARDGAVPRRNSVAIAVRVAGDLAAEASVADAEVGCREHHAQRPPDEADVRGVRAGQGFSDGNVAGRIEGRGKHSWVKPRT